MKQEELDKIFKHSQHARDRMPKASVWEQLEQQLDTEQPKVLPAHSTWKWLAAAGIVLLLLPSLWFISKQLGQENQLAHSTHTTKSQESLSADETSQEQAPTSKKTLNENTLDQETVEATGTTEAEVKEVDTAIKTSTTPASRSAKENSKTNRKSKSVKTQSETKSTKVLVPTNVPRSKENQIAEASQPSNPIPPAGPVGAAGANADVISSAMKAPPSFDTAAPQMAEEESIDLNAGASMAEADDALEVTPERSSKSSRDAKSLEPDWKKFMPGTWTSNEHVTEIWLQKDDFLLIMYPNAEQPTRQVFDQPAIGLHGNKAQYAYTIVENTSEQLIIQGNTSEDAQTYVYKRLNNNQLQVNIFAKGSDNQAMKTYKLERK